MKQLWQLFLAFARVGVMTFGGGYAMIPILEREIVDRQGWASSEELMDYYAVGQCTPGVIAVNTATFIGYKVAGSLGGVVATLGVVFPSLVIITVIAAFLTNFANLPVVKDAFAGIRVAVCILIFQAVRRLAAKAVVDKITLTVFLIVMAINMLTDISPAWLVVTAGAVGILTKKLGGGQ